MAMLSKKSGGLSDKVEQQMTPMIDIVFQLLAFFVMTFKVATPEGDFSINMPIGPPTSQTIEDLNVPPIKVAMQADANGNLAAIIINPGQPDAVSLGTDLKALGPWMQQKYRSLSGPNNLAKEQEIELNCDYRLKYGATMIAVTAVSGYIDPSTGTPFPLFEKVKFSRPKKRPGS